MLKMVVTGSSRKLDDYLRGLSKLNVRAILERYGQDGVNALSNATPKDSGDTAAAWSYEIENKNGDYIIHWKNTHNEGGPPIAVLIQYGHGTGTGGYVQGRDFINPAIRPVFDRIANEVWKEVTTK